MEHDGWIIKMPTLIAGKYFLIKTFFHHLLFSFFLFQYVVFFLSCKILFTKCLLTTSLSFPQANMKPSVEPEPTSVHAFLCVCQ